LRIIPSMQHIVPILEIFQVTHDVKCFRIGKPTGYEFLPGHATDLSINQPGLEEETRPFTFTGLAKQPYLEFTIKRYPDHHGVTDQLHQLHPGDELILRDSWGAIEYKAPGYFIAGGAGITPFIAILRSLKEENKAKGNKLFFSNKTSEDVIYHEELADILGSGAIFILTREKREGYEYGRVDSAFIRNHIADFQKHFYICGPDPMVHDLTALVQELGASADQLVFEK
jgi:ferredoxin-NADP reductase